MNRLKDQIACVTGAGNGIGRAIALRFAAEGAHVIALDVHAQSAQAVATEIHAAGGKAEAIAADVGDENAVREAYAGIAARHGRLDIQVSHAGITNRKNFLQETVAGLDKILRVNFYGAFLCGQAAARLMLEKGGRIVNTTSVSGQQGGTGRAAYGASKAAIINLTQTMAVELARHNILVNAIAPGPTEVARTAHAAGQRAAFLARLAMKRYATPEDLANAALFLCSPDNSYVTGHVLNVDGGFMAAGVMYDPDEQDLSRPAR